MAMLGAMVPCPAISGKLVLRGVSELSGECSDRGGYVDQIITYTTATLAQHRTRQYADYGEQRQTRHFLSSLSVLWSPGRLHSHWH